MRLAFCLVVAGVSFTGIHAQELIKDSTKPQQHRTHCQRTGPSFGKRTERQNAKLDQLQKTIAEQHKRYKHLLEKLSVNKPTGPSVDNSLNAATTSVPATATQKCAATTTQTPTVEQRLAKVEGRH